MRDILVIHVGQCGIQVGADFWRQIMYEDGLTADGIPKDQVNDNVHHGIFFDETSNLSYSPRALFIDGDNHVVEEALSKPCLKNVISPESMITYNQSSSGVYSRAKFMIAKAISHSIMHGLRRTIERTDYLDSIYSFSSISGGCGSGLMTFVNNLIKDVVPNIYNYHHAVLPSQNLDTGTLAPYNAILHLNDCRASVDLRCIYNNESLYNILDPIMPAKMKSVHYDDMNYLISLVPSHITRGIRSHSGKVTVNLDSSDHLMNNLVPFPQLNMVSTAIVPLRKRACKTMSTLVSVTSEAFLNHQEMCNIELYNGKYMACCLHYCGDVNVKECHDVVADVRTEFQIPFVEWIPTGFKITMDPEPTVHPLHKDYLNSSNLTLLKISNHTGIQSALSHIVDKYSVLLQNRAYVWWYISEGMEEGEFDEAKENVLHDLAAAQEVHGGMGEEEEE